MRHQRHLFLVTALAVAVVYIANLTIDVMEVDAAQYAGISLEMKSTGSYLEVYHRGQDYLDKPPLLFWLASTTMRILGVSNLSYKLLALLVLLLGIYSTYRFTRLYHDRETGLFAAAILATTQAYFLMTNDVRTDGLLTGFVIFSVWQCAAYLQRPHILHLVLAGLGIGLAMLAKGPIGAIIPAIAIACDRLFQGRWRDLFRPGWLLVVVIAGLVLVPMCIGLYQQFDLHPEKTVYELQGPSGLKFFFWTQSFGRITGEIYWDNNTPAYYFLLTFLWDFMPWTIAGIAGMVFAIRSMIKDRKSLPEFATIGGFVFVLLLLSLSRYKLPHYIFPLFPFAAVLTARYLRSGSARSLHFLATTQFVLLHAFFIIPGIVYFLFFPPQHLVIPALTLIGLVCFWFAYLSTTDSANRILWTGLVAAITFNLMMSLHLYPHLMQYQSGSVAGRMIAEDRREQSREYYAYPISSLGLDFYSGAYIPAISEGELSQVPVLSWIYTNAEGMQSITTRWPDTFAIIREFPHYHVSMLKWKFMDKRTREQVVQPRYLLEKRISTQD